MRLVCSSQLVEKFPDRKEIVMLPKYDDGFDDDEEEDEETDV